MLVWILKAMIRFLLVGLILIVLLTGRGVLNLTPLEETAGKHLYSIAQWEFENLLDKWLYKVRTSIPGRSLNEEENVGIVLEYFRLGEIENELKYAIMNSRDSSDDVSDGNADTLKNDLAQVTKTRNEMRDAVEEIIEGVIDSIVYSEDLSKLRLINTIGIHFPPVDFRLEKSPRILVVSPRDRIEMIDGILLNADMNVDDMEVLEQRFLIDQNLSVLVQATGGVSTYPAVVSTDFSLKGMLATAAHEWLHNYLFFHPLGRSYNKSTEMTSINETLANMFGREVGDLAYKKFEISQTNDNHVESVAGSVVDLNDFNFRIEMRTTRLKVEDMLADGNIDEAEEYMEERRLFMLDHGYYIRKLNQAYFAFHGRYTDSPASISPIFDQLSIIRKVSPSLGAFVRNMADVSDHNDFLELLSISRSTTTGTGTTFSEQ